ncbi:ribosome biogenesis GTP-binding protein YihA/YsxC [Neomegalonema sp.]|uniref:ribosome biogenesis GTP-binding protein YihA/YsxC n=1 Tax=Neomegalonema sp. TaxID=2039713 RepID=UPI0026257901|nr:ribosome biogenesis GTP-binding protein YihA/YsxC [Neomegalonema sp.]MDD2869471.1 ribosome biogenesis GTP-binding protein YihA/YsxC [Neomegalonema sp.]
MARPDPQSFFQLDPPVSPEDLEAGRVLFAHECKFMLSVAHLDQLPEPDPEALRTEVCFAGRSNVGKSSLINALTGRKILARASNTPGRTQQLNFFDLGEKVWLVDLPGYGYAQAPKDLVDRWQKVLKAYLRGRQSLRRVFVLIDSRHGVKAVDHEILDMLDKAAVSFQVVLTKTDKISRTALEEVAVQVRAELGRHATSYPEIISTSSETGKGLPELRAAIGKLTRD